MRRPARVPARPTTPAAGVTSTARSSRSAAGRGSALPGVAPIVAAVLMQCLGLPAHAQGVLAVAAVQAPVEIIGTSPLPGLGLPKDLVPANVQTASGADIERSHALDLASFLNRALGSVHINELQNNGFQPEINYRGFTASPLLGTPQGLSVYVDGVRMNQPFGDVVSWDLMPRGAIASVALMPGSNPLFGLNTLGGALAVHTKDGRRHPGTAVQAIAGDHGRSGLSVEHGGRSADDSHWYLAANRLHDEGWRAASPSDLSQLFGKAGHHFGDTDLWLSIALAENDLSGHGLQEQGAMRRDRFSIYTRPDATVNRSVLLNLAATRQVGDAVELSGNVYYRRIRTRSFNGDANDGALDQSVYQPNAAERAALAAAGYSGYPASGATAANTPFPRWRCIANALLNEEPNEKCNALLNHTQTHQTQAGFAGQLSARGRWAGVDHRLVAGAALDLSRVAFAQSAQFGFINPDRTVTPVEGPGALADGTQNSENAFDSRVDLRSRTRTASLYASDTIAFGERTHLTLSGRYNRHAITNIDRLQPGGGSGSLDGDYRYSRFNPAIGLRFAHSPTLTVYASANQGSRAPTAVELGCADPATPCRLPNAFAGDPPLQQVVTTTAEAGMRGTAAQRLTWNVGVFRSDNRNDLLFVSDNANGFGYFKNFGRTRRQGLEFGLSGQPLRSLSVGVQLTLLDATFRTAERVGGAGNSSNDNAAAGLPGVEGRIEIRPGDRIPLMPDRILKLDLSWLPTPTWTLGADVTAISASTARGNENGQQQPDGRYYTGDGRSPGYAVLNLGVEYRPSPRWKVFVQLNNALDQRYSTGAQLGANAFDAAGNYSARALPRNAQGDYPVARSAFYAPGAPRSGWLGVRRSFD